MIETKRNDLYKNWKRKIYEIIINWEDNNLPDKKKSKKRKWREQKWKLRKEKYNKETEKMKKIEVNNRIR